VSKTPGQKTKYEVWWYFCSYVIIKISKKSVKDIYNVYALIFEWWIVTYFSFFSMILHFVLNFTYGRIARCVSKEADFEQISVQEIY
jgi:hypothetical protein